MEICNEDLMNLKQGYFYLMTFWKIKYILKPHGTKLIYLLLRTRQNTSPQHFAQHPAVFLGWNLQDWKKIVAITETII